MSADAQATAEAAGHLALESTVTELEPCRVKLQVTVKGQSVNEAYDEAYGELQESAQIRGFRRGHAPRRMLERKFFRHLRKDIARKLFGEGLRQCLQENDLHAMAEPDIDLDELEAAPGEAFSFAVEMDVRPKFELPQYRGLELEERVAPVTEEDIRLALEDIRANFAEARPTDEPMGEERQATADIRLEVDGETVAKADAATLRMEITTIFGLDAKPVIEKITGCKAGEEVELTITLPDTFHREELRGKTALLKIAIKAVQRLELPEFDDDFVKQRMRLESLDQLRQMLRSSRQEENRRRAREAMNDEVIERLTAAADFDVPAELLKRRSAAIAARRRLQLKRTGATDDGIDEQAEKIEQESTQSARRDLRWMIIYETIAEQENLEVTPQDIQQHIEALARAFGTTPAQTLRRIENLGGMQDVIGTLREVKVINFILEHANIKTQQPNGEGAKSGGDADAQQPDATAAGSTTPTTEEQAT